MKFKYLVLSLIGALQAGVPGSAPRQPAACYPPVDPPRLRISPAGAVDLGELGPLDRVDLIVVSLPFVEPFGTSVASWAAEP